MNRRYCNGMVHVIKPGDTLYQLSRYYRIPMAMLLRANPYVDVYNLQLSGKLKNKQTGEPLKICMHHMTSPDPCMNNGINCPIRKATTKKVAR